MFNTKCYFSSWDNSIIFQFPKILSLFSFSLVWSFSCLSSLCLWRNWRFLCFVHVLIIEYCNLTRYCYDGDDDWFSNYGGFHEVDYDGGVWNVDEDYSQCNQYDGDDGIENHDDDHHAHGDGDYDNTLTNKNEDYIANAYNGWRSEERDGANNLLFVLHFSNSNFSLSVYNAFWKRLLWCVYRFGLFGIQFWFFHVQTQPFPFGPKRNLELLQIANRNH